MTRSRKVRILVPLVLAAALALPPASAEPGSKRDRPRSATTSLWDTVKSIWEAIGCKIDPHGGCIGEQPAPPPATDIGCKLDPNGDCVVEEPAAAPETDIGCKIDPNGGCVSES